MSRGLGGEESSGSSKGASFVPLTVGRFRFHCHPAVQCFNECCADLRLVLTPYDVLRMKRRLRLLSWDFLKEFTVPDWDENPYLPMLRLRMREEGRKPCPFVTEAGCSIYPDRPGACRLYPLGRGARAAQGTGREVEFYFVVREDHCMGFLEDREWTLEEWLKDQEVALYNEMNRPWMEIVTSSHPGLKRMDERKLAMFYMASYDLDRFRSFVLNSGFVERFDLPEGELEAIKRDDLPLFSLAMKWIRFALFGEMTLPLKTVSQSHLQSRFSIP